MLRRKARQSGESEMRMKLGNDPGSSTGNTQSVRKRLDESGSYGLSRGG